MLQWPLNLISIKKKAANILTVSRNRATSGDQIASGTIMIAPHGHSWAQSPQPLQKS
jgi:hypothetical protein